MVKSRCIPAMIITLTVICCIICISPQLVHICQVWVGWKKKINEKKRKQENSNEQSTSVPKQTCSFSLLIPLIIQMIIHHLFSFVNILICDISGTCPLALPGEKQTKQLTFSLLSLYCQSWLHLITSTNLDVCHIYSLGYWKGYGLTTVVRRPHPARRCLPSGPLMREKK